MSQMFLYIAFWNLIIYSNAHWNVWELVCRQSPKHLKTYNQSLHQDFSLYYHFDSTYLFNSANLQKYHKNQQLSWKQSHTLVFAVCLLVTKIMIRENCVLSKHCRLSRWSLIPNEALLPLSRDIYSYECLELNYIGLNAMLSLVYENR